MDVTTSGPEHKDKCFFGTKNRNSKGGDCRYNGKAYFLVLKKVYKRNSFAQLVVFQVKTEIKISLDFITLKLKST